MLQVDDVHNRVQDRLNFGTHRRASCQYRSRIRLADVCIGEQLRELAKTRFVRASPNSPGQDEHGCRRIVSSKKMADLRILDLGECIAWPPRPLKLNNNCREESRTLFFR